jgi:hypothetical protein
MGELLAAFLLPVLGVVVWLLFRIEQRLTEIAMTLGQPQGPEQEAITPGHVRRRRQPPISDVRT